MSYTDNADEVARAWETAAPKNHTLTLDNVAAYAKYLHDKAGFYVFNDAVAVEAVIRWLSDIIGAGMELTDDHIEKALDSAGYEVVAFLQSLTSTLRPPVKAGEGMRKAHPGGWSDVRSVLAGAYRHAVDNRSPTTHNY